LTGAFASFAAAASFDWVWELTAIGLVTFVALGLLCSAAAARPSPMSAVEAQRPPWRARYAFGLGAAILLVAWSIAVAQAIPLLANGEISDSEAALARDDLDAAFSSARAARDIQPWAATPYLQLALVSEQAELLPRARLWINEAIDRDERDWRLWLVSARLETKLGRVEAAERSLRRAVSLNPRSPLFSGLLDENRRVRLHVRSAEYVVPPEGR
jgi:tetratricopeptide (TPR) repeat protein